MRQRELSASSAAMPNRSMKLRDGNIEKLGQGVHDALVIGGGINGAVSAAALAGQGARVALIDRGDFAGFTSQQSSNLAWGGIKYLESNDFGLVWGLCKSRNHLMDSFPSSVREIRFYSMIEKGFRHHPRFIWLGTWLYWLFGRGHTRIPRWLSPCTVNREEPVIRTDSYYGGFEYSDACLFDNDARFVFQFIRAAMDHGGIAANYVESIGARRKDGIWTTRARDGMSGREFEIRARVLINAAGPFVDEHNLKTGEKTEHRHVFSKGIHLIVPRLTPSQRVLTFFADDGRLFFAIPMGLRTCVGTTDTRSESPFSEVSDDDRRFVLDNINKRLKLDRLLTREDIIAERCGIRPLVVSAANGNDGERDWMQMSRKHAVDASRETAHISIFGGKLTDCINVGNEVAGYVAAMGVALPAPGRKWYGEPDAVVRGEFLSYAKQIKLDGIPTPDFSEPVGQTLWRRYGREAFALLDAIRADPRQADILIEGADYLRCEIGLIRDREMVTTLDDFLRRRSKLALVMHKEDIHRAEGLAEACSILFGEQAQSKLDEYFAQHAAETAPD